MVLDSSVGWCKTERFICIHRSREDARGGDVAVITASGNDATFMKMHCSGT